MFRDSLFLTTGVMDDDAVIFHKAINKISRMQIQANRPTTSKNSQLNNRKYEKFLNEIYTCVQDKEPTKRNNPDIFDQLPKLLQKQQIIGLTPIQEITPQKKSSKKSAYQSKNTKFKNFISTLDEHQRKLSNENMNLLGLEVRKISYCEKQKKNAERQGSELPDQNNMAMSAFIKEEKRSSESRLIRGRNTITYYTPQNDFTCRKIGMNHREIMSNRKIISASQKRKNSSSTFRTRQKPKSSKVQLKRRVIADSQNPVYDSRINSYKQLIFKVNFAHGVYIETEKDLIDEEFNLKAEMKYKAWIGEGNNGNLIKSLLKRRFWWTILDEKPQKANFLWTQLKNNEYFTKQPKSDMWQIDREKGWGKYFQIKSHPMKKMKIDKNKKKNSDEKPNEEQYHNKIFVDEEILRYKDFSTRFNHKNYQQKQQILGLRKFDSMGVKMHNHLTNNFFLGNKKALYYNLKEYYDLLGKNAFTKIPLTFHIKKGFNDIQYKRFVTYFKRREMLMKRQEKEADKKEEPKKKMRNVWIVKPGELTNRGHGITVIDEVYQLNSIMKREGQHSNGSQKTFIVQLYIDRPLLYQKRKFDIRQYMLITHIHGLMRAYWFKQGYIRTSSYEFDIENFDREIHLTNDAVQKYLPGYGKYEPANKLSFLDFQRYLDATYPKKNYNFQKQILPEMKSICLDSVKSSYLKLSPERLQHNFEIFGMDFMIDSSFKPWLIEINTNPCLELCCPFISRLIPQMLEQAFRLSLDIVFPPPCNYPNTTKHLAPDASLQNLNFQLIFDEKCDGQQIRKLYNKTTSNLLQQIGDISEDETYQDEGKDISLDQIL